MSYMALAFSNRRLGRISKLRKDWLVALTLPKEDVFNEAVRAEEFIRCKFLGCASVACASKTRLKLNMDKPGSTAYMVRDFGPVGATLGYLLTGAGAQH